MTTIEIERDTHAFAIVKAQESLDRASGGGLEWDRPIDKDAADLVQAMVGALPFDRICEDLLDATLKGFAVSEIKLGTDATLIRPVRIVSHNQRRFCGLTC